MIIIHGAIPPELYRFSYTVYSMQSERLDQEKPILEKPTHLKTKVLKFTWWGMRGEGAYL